MKPILEDRWVPLIWVRAAHSAHLSALLSLLMMAQVSLLIFPQPSRAIVLYATDAECDCIYTIDTANPEPFALSHYTLPSSECCIVGACFDDSGNYYGISASDRAGLYKLDAASGRLTLVWRLSLSYVFEGGLAFDRTSGLLYGVNVSWFEGTGLFSIDPTTGHALVLGEIGGGRHDFAGIEFDDSGQLFGIDSRTNALWKIDKSDPLGDTTYQVGSGLGNGITLGPGGGMTMDAAAGVCYGYAIGSRTLFTIDLATGVGTPIAHFEFGNLLSLAYPGESQTPVLPATWGQLKSLYR